MYSLTQRKFHPPTPFQFINSNKVVMGIFPTQLPNHSLHTSVNMYVSYGSTAIIYNHAIICSIFFLAEVLFFLAFLKKGVIWTAKQVEGGRMSALKSSPINFFWDKFSSLLANCLGFSQHFVKCIYILFLFGRLLLFLFYSFWLDIQTMKQEGVTCSVGFCCLILL